ncbi:hypothetical protein BKA70DRAFT_1179328 [Coprinopsis sp. MPI-PUGE-AT-0042]|nr:hypothetical protein BKA70DRAFT_1179328 [Coprinopsis sp. MPI-PUGE-AT-0042]
MSAVRRLDTRSQARKTQASPYARPQPQQSSSWSLRSFLEPIRRRVFGEASESQEINGRGRRQIVRSPSPSSVGIPEEPSYSSVYTYQSSATEPPRSPSKSTSPKRPAPVEGLTPNATMENVLDWLTDATGSTLKRDDAYAVVRLIHKGIPSERTVTGSLTQSVGRPLGAIEVEGMISILRKQMPRRCAPSEPFRFKTSTPSRDTTPTVTTPAPRKMLTRNPNGAYRWQGAGSSKVNPRRNRYNSPAFGASNVTPAKTKAGAGASGGDMSTADGKRRKVDSGDSSYFPPATSSPQSSASTSNALPYPISSSPNSRPATNGTTASPSKITIPPAQSAAPPRLRTPTFKPSLPSQPSPLRNAWTGSPDSSLEEISVGKLSPPKQPTQAASFMSELIEKVTPAKKPDDLTNPYQIASPVAKVGPPRRSARRTRPARPAASDVPEQKKEEQKVEESTRDLPPEAIFEATLPKGSKRSRPPANLDKSASYRSPSPVTNGKSQDTEMQDYTVEEVDEDRTSKKQKGLNGLASPPSRSHDIAVEEVDEEEAASMSESASGSSLSNGGGVNGFSSRHSFGGFKPTAVPSRPSKLRFSYQAEVSAPSSPDSQADAEPASKSSSMDLDAPPPPTLNTTFSLSASSKPAPAPSAASPSSTFASSSKPAVSSDPKAQALSTPAQSLQTFAFAVPSTSIPSKHAAAAEKAKAQSASSLPAFDLSAPAGPSGSSEAPKSTGFNWAAAGMKPPSGTAASQWTCTLCGLNSPDSAKDCTVCEAPRPSAKKSDDAPKSTGFNWAAAGMKPPSGASKWKCTVCDLENPDEVKDKCTVCDTPRPGAKPEPPKSSGGFNWHGAGIKPPPLVSNQWTCSMCGLKNPDSTTKCTICDSLR